MLQQSSLANAINTIELFEEIENALKDLDSNALVVFDVDETLIISLDRIRRKNSELFIQQLNNTYFSTIQDDKHKEYLHSIQLLMSEQKLIEPKIQELIKNLQEKNIRVIALTNISTGSYHAINSMEDWRYRQLYDLGIDLSIHNPEILTFNQLPKGRSAHPIFYKGILATARSCQKGKTLTELLNQLNWKPSKIVFFEDCKSHAQSVYDCMLKLGIPCEVYHYLATQSNVEPINIEIAQFQYDYLLKNQIWINEETAAFLINNNQ
jgi:hypothetical protein